MSAVTEDLCCPICQDIFKDPVVISCSHSFCKTCLQKWWKEKKTLECPICKRKSSRSDPPRNLVLKNLCEAYERPNNHRAHNNGSEQLCSLHSEKLKIFCLDHQQPVCVICRDSKIHNQHHFRPLNEAAQEKREELQKFLKPLQEKLTRMEEAKGDGEKTVKFIKLQSQQTEKQIKEQFHKLYQFLQQEEKAKVAALKEEETTKMLLMKKNLEALSKDIAALSAMITAAKKELTAADISFLKNYKTTMNKVHQHPLHDDPQQAPGALIDVAKYLGNLTFQVWNNMKQVVSYSPVILDPNTADPELVLSHDLCSVRSGEKKPIPLNPERTKFSCSVLGSEGFNSGCHSWSVKVGDNKDWELGVLGETQTTNECPTAQLWRISFTDGKFTAFSSSKPEEDLLVKDVVRKIRVYLDFDRGKLTFSDFDTTTNIHTFTDTFSNTLFPYIYTESQSPLRIIPANISVSVPKST
ncbi:PREDICTED: nuclear factor 7, ovary-like [Cyprinodon variegatus]|uniref:nuclear factor 7, ovary-like n=1 Tax=Cyprinodon variegatus TaxID=28743 RepID=UPI000742C366|nr:PREDICTED: nuclear factor 7, ovary-like [Cyprinodon variegatus]